jgi:hypothetical protein
MVLETGHSETAPAFGAEYISFGTARLAEG